MVHALNMFEQINELSIVVSAILGVAIGSIWYSPVLFESFLSRPLSSAIVSQKKLVFEAVLHIVILVVFFCALGYLATYLREVPFSFGAIATLLSILVVMQVLTLTIRERYSYTYFLVHAGYSLLIVFAGLSVMIYWPW